MYVLCKDVQYMFLSIKYSRYEILQKAVATAN